ncbi:uncharacterized protein LOC115627298 [Scaptodrosophila lebanonensis]|uniref:Uncharacterized protein LOC115627298 n=1 Tax=Drosophila lebanonensis TaxID=7225 RepID=A0A6J2TQ53_DROLE|nr:uncharacterized protein LOC115627298 [Scaptodrosophila lebanonensis]
MSLRKRKETPLMNAAMRIRRENYIAHRKRVRFVHSLVDSTEPRVPPRSLADIDMLLVDASCYQQRTRDNVRMLLNLARTMRTRGRLDTRSCPNLESTSMQPTMLIHLKRLDKANIKLGKRILFAQLFGKSLCHGCAPTPYSSLVLSPSYQRRPESDSKLCLSVYSAVHEGKDEKEIFSKYAGWDLEMPDDKIELTRLLRPRIVLHFGSVDGRPLGVVVFQLYTEAAPLIVLELIRQCMSHKPHKFSVRRIFPTLWMDCYLQGNKTPLKGPIEFDTRVIDHGRQGYVLSCAKDYCLNGFPGAILNFTISFKPLRVLNGKRVGFGRVLRGARIIHSMELYGTRNGKMSKRVIVTHCDVL